MLMEKNAKIVVNMLKKSHSHQIIIIKLIFQQGILLKLKSTWNMKKLSLSIPNLKYRYYWTESKCIGLIPFNDQHISEGDTSFFFFIFYKQWILSTQLWIGTLFVKPKYRREKFSFFLTFSLFTLLFSLLLRFSLLHFKNWVNHTKTPASTLLISFDPNESLGSNKTFYTFWEAAGTRSITQHILHCRFSTVIANFWDFN